MKKETLFSICLRVIAYLVAISLLGLMYWSYVLQEERLKEISAQVEELQNALTSKHNSLTDLRQSKQIQNQENYTNILEKDLYAENVLPSLLGKKFTPHGVLRMAVVGGVNSLHPFSLWAEEAEWNGYCQGTAAKEKFGYYETLTADFATKIEERPLDAERTSFWVHLREDLYWHPLKQEHFPDTVQLAPHFLQKQRVTAHDFQFFFHALSNMRVDAPEAVTLRFALADIERIDVVDTSTFKVIVKKTKRDGSYDLPYATRFNIAQLRPLARFVYQYNADGTKIVDDDVGPEFYKTSSLWAEAFQTHFASHVIVSCGPWVFDGMSDRQVRFRRNEEYYDKNSALYEAMEIYFLESPEAIFRDFVAGKIDICTVLPQNLAEVDNYLKSKEYAEMKQKGLQVNRIDSPLRSYSFVAWNQKNSLFQDKNVRKALTLAIDQTRLIRQNLYGKAVAITGPFFISSHGYNTAVQPYPYDVEEAKRLLAHANWVDSDGDGVLDKDGIPFRFFLTYYVKNPLAKANCDLIASCLKEIGVDCVLKGVDLADLSLACDDKSFDALYLGWQQSSGPVDPRQLWHSESLNMKGSSNLVGFSNKKVDRIIDELQFEKNLDARNKALRTLHAMIYEEQPYTFLFTPTASLLFWNWERNIFIPKERQDLLPGADWEQPTLTYSWKVGEQ